MRYNTFLLSLLLSLLLNIFAFNTTNAQSKLEVVLDSLNIITDETVARVDLLNEAAWEYRNANPLMGIEYGKKALKIAEKVAYGKGLNKALSYIGVNYKNAGDYTNALDFFVQSSESSRKNQDKEAEGHSYNNIGEIQRIQKQYKDADISFQKALEAGTAANDQKLVAYAHNSFGKLYKDEEKYTEALASFEKALEIRKKVKDLKAVASTIEAISKTYEAKGDFAKAIESYNQAVKFSKEFHDLRGEITAELGIARILFQTKKYDKVIIATENIVETANKNKLKPEEKDAYDLLFRTYEKMGNMGEAFKYQTKFMKLKDELFNENNEKSRSFLEKSYQDAQNKANIQETNAQNAKLKDQQRITYIVGALVALGLIISSVFLYFLTRSNKETKRKSKDLELAFNEIEKQNKENNENTQYASRIQHAILPKELEIDLVFIDNFIFSKAKSKIESSFYWTHQRNEKVYVSLVTCTAQDMAGGLLSIVSSLSLRKAVIEKSIANVDEILFEVNQDMLKVLKDNKDGIQIGIFMVDFVKNVVEIAGTGVYTLLMVDNEQKDVTAGQFQLGNQSLESNPFAKAQYPLTDNMRIYMASKPIQELSGLVQQNYQQPMYKQKYDLDKLVAKSSEDMLVMGLRLY